MPACLNAANEELVAGFLAKKIRFVEIPRHIETVMGRHHGRPAQSLEDVLETDSWARAATRELIGQ
jgi:1-deoxy-D-xylulose-5-phosphate reductoisomerase